jgi:hypothetical protein
MDSFLKRSNQTKVLQLTQVFANAGLDIVTSAMCKHQQWFGLDLQSSTLEDIEIF